jgi:hypothetical protein
MLRTGIRAEWIIEVPPFQCQKYLGFIKLQLEALGPSIARETKGSDDMFVSVA